MYRTSQVSHWLGIAEPCRVEDILAAFTPSCLRGSEPSDRYCDPTLRQFSEGTLPKGLVTTSVPFQTHPGIPALRFCFMYFDCLSLAGPLAHERKSAGCPLS